MITLSDEKSETMIFKALKTGFIENKGQSGPLSVVSKTLKANVSSQIIKFWPFFSCQLTPSRPPILDHDRKGRFLQKS